MRNSEIMNKHKGNDEKRRNKSNVIITFSNAKHGDFLTDHWLHSLMVNVDLSDIDVVVLDYGLNKKQLEKLKRAKVKIVKCECDGHITAVRFRDMADFLRKNNYDQVLSCDGGDVIFQTDISDIFEKDKDALRAACEGYRMPFEKLSLSLQKSITPAIAAEVKKYNGRMRKMINAGVIIGPRKKFIELCDFCYNNIAGKKFGPDMVLVNYFLYKHNFVELDCRYNFILYTSRVPFVIKDGKFYDDSGKLIPIVHNAGWLSPIRAIASFGYGPKHNRIRLGRFYLLRTLIKTFNVLFYS